MDQFEGIDHPRASSAKLNLLAEPTNGTSIVSPAGLATAAIKVGGRKVPEIPPISTVTTSASQIGQKAGASVDSAGTVPKDQVAFSLLDSLVRLSTYLSASLEKLQVLDRVDRKTSITRDNTARSFEDRITNSEFISPSVPVRPSPSN